MSAVADNRGADGMLSIVVASLTFRRPEGLRKLLESLEKQIHHPERPYRLTVVIVDNDASGSSRAVAEAFAQSAAYRLIYEIEPRQGIPIARNHALDAAPPETDLFCFLDDDEWVVENWLDAMLATRTETGADIVYGPVEPAYDPGGDRYFVRTRIFERKQNAEGAPLDYAASNNVMMDLRRIREAGLRFADAMRYTGGSDYLFFNQAFRRGLRIHWSANAIVYDVIPASRMTWKWVLQRQYRLGNTFAVASRLQDGVAARTKLLGVGIARSLVGAAMTPALVLSPRLGMRGLVHMIRGAGIVSGLLGHAYNEYDPQRIAADGKSGEATG